MFTFYVMFTRTGGLLVTGEQAESEGDAYAHARKQSAWPEGATAAHIYREPMDGTKTLIATFTKAPA